MKTLYKRKHRSNHSLIIYDLKQSTIKKVSQYIGRKIMKNLVSQMYSIK